MADTQFTNDGSVVVAVPVFSPLRTPLTPEERANPPVITLSEDDRGVCAEIDPPGARPIMRVECQIHTSLIYLITRPPRPATRAADSNDIGPLPHNAGAEGVSDSEFMLWRQEHGGFAPIRLGKELKHRMLAAPGALKRWQTSDLRIHELEVEGRNDLLSTVLLIPSPGMPSGETEAETHIFLGTVELEDSDWLRAWIDFLDNGRRIAERRGDDYNTTRIVKL